MSSGKQSDAIQKVLAGNKGKALQAAGNDTCSTSGELPSNRIASVINFHSRS
jgi:hypothetical protein